MIHKIIFAIILATGVSYCSSETVESVKVKTVASVKVKTELTPWKPSIEKKKSGDSCKDGNCFKGSNCLTKNGAGYKLISSMFHKMKAQCKKL